MQFLSYMIKNFNYLEILPNKFGSKRIPNKNNIKIIRQVLTIQFIYFQKLINKKSKFNIKSQTSLKKSLL